MWIDRAGRILCISVAGAVLWAAPAMADKPLSAIDWLSQSVATPAGMPASGITLPALAPREPAVMPGGLPPPIDVSVLGAQVPDAVGLLSPATTGLPRALWGAGQTTAIVQLIQTERVETLPALQDLLMTLLLAEADAPADSGPKGTLLLARVDRLLDMGALDQAEALLEAAGSRRPELFRRAFDVALLTGNEDRACTQMLAAPELAPTFPARVFCLARSGDWNAAALTLRTAQALGFVTEEEDALLSRFLDPDLFEGEPPLPKPTRVSPLVWRMLEAIGEPLPTNTLPLAFAQADLRENAGWKAQIEAAERLARHGALDANRLLGIYSERLPAASGGVWDRVEALQRFDTAITAADPGAVAASLPGAWAAMAQAELEVPFAALYADVLQRMPLTGDAAALAFRVMLLSPDYEKAAVARKPADGYEAFLVGLARGGLNGVPPPDSMARAIAQAFGMAQPSASAQMLLDEQRLGEALLTTIDRIAEGATGDLRGVTDGLALLRRVGLDDFARRTALQLMLLERRG